MYGEDFPLEGELDARKILVESLREGGKSAGSLRPSQDRRRTSALMSATGSMGSLAASQLGRRESGRMAQQPNLHLKLMEKLGDDPMAHLKVQEATERKTTGKKSGSGNEEEESQAVVKRTAPVKSPILTYIQDFVKLPVHLALSTLLKGAVVLDAGLFAELVPVCWELLSHADPNVAAAAAALFIVASVKESAQAVAIIRKELESLEPGDRIQAVERFYALWRNRYHCWVKMEDGAHVVFKVPPPGIDFTLPSPPIGQSQVPVADPPWMPHMKTRVQELTLNEEEDTTVRPYTFLPPFFL